MTEAGASVMKRIEESGERTSTENLRGFCARRRTPNEQPQRLQTTPRTLADRLSAEGTRGEASELLDRPFHTYRYHLANGIERVAPYAGWSFSRRSAALPDGSPEGEHRREKPTCVRAARLAIIAAFASSVLRNSDRGFFAGSGYTGP